jgi:hypothetical protein
MSPLKPSLQFLRPAAGAGLWFSAAPFGSNRRPKPTDLSQPSSKILSLLLPPLSQPHTGPPPFSLMNSTSAAFSNFLRASHGRHVRHHGGRGSVAVSLMAASVRCLPNPIAPKALLPSPALGSFRQTFQAHIMMRAANTEDGPDASGPSEDPTPPSATSWKRSRAKRIVGRAIDKSALRLLRRAEFVTETTFDMWPGRPMVERDAQWAPAFHRVLARSSQDGRRQRQSLSFICRTEHFTLNYQGVSHAQWPNDNPECARPRPPASFGAHSKRWTSSVVRPEPKSFQNAQRNYSGIWRSPALKLRSATRSEQRITTSTPNIISDQCAPTQMGSKRFRHESEEIDLPCRD